MHMRICLGAGEMLLVMKLCKINTQTSGIYANEAHEAADVKEPQQVYNKQLLHVL